MDALAEISHGMASHLEPNAKVRRIAAVTAIHTDRMYSSMGAPAGSKRSLVAIGAEPVVEYSQESDEVWLDDEADEARPATGGAGDVYDDTWDIEAGAPI